MNNKNDRHRDDKLEAGELNRQAIREKNGNDEERELSETEKKISNFWYYNKWKVIISIGVVIVLIITTCQMCSNTKQDGNWMYAGSYYIPASQRTSLEKITALYLPEDVNDDGIKCVAMTVVNVYSDEQVKELNAQVGTDTEKSRVNTQTNQESLANFNNLILAGEYSVCVVEPWLYENVEKGGGFRKLADVLGEKPEGAYSDYAVYLSDTAVYKDNPGLFDGFTADTLVCLRTESQIGKLFGKKEVSEEYKISERYFVNLVQGIE